MILFELIGTEQHPVYQDLQISNGIRQYSFLQSIVVASLSAGRPYLSQHVIKALNFQAITCLHTNPGEYRPVEVYIQGAEHRPPATHSVQALMDDFVNYVNRFFEQSDPVYLAAYVLWRLNYIHPFINGNGRTARAACYFVLCLRLGSPIAGTIILPELIKREREEYVVALREADESYRSGSLDLTHLHGLIARLLTVQISSAEDPIVPTQVGP